MKVFEELARRGDDEMGSDENARVGRVLEVGAGVGITTRRMLGHGWSVTALDPNPVMRRRFRAHMGFDAHARAFEDFVPNVPPFERSSARAYFEPDRFAAGLRDHLNPAGQGLLLLASTANERALLGAFEERSFAVETAARRDVRVEVLTLYRLTRR